MVGHIDVFANDRHFRLSLRKQGISQRRSDGISISNVNIFTEGIKAFEKNIEENDFSLLPMRIL